MARTHKATPVRAWIRLLMCSHMIESQVRGRLRAEFESTLPRFDVLAQLEMMEAAKPEGLTMSELSRRLMVSNGNLTGLTSRLLREHLVERVPSVDRRRQRVRLTAAGRRAFGRMASAHRSWLQEMFRGLEGEELEHFYGALGTLRDSIQIALEREPLETRSA